jgi:hypothetical protein
MREEQWLHCLRCKENLARVETIDGRTYVMLGEYRVTRLIIFCRCGASRNFFSVKVSEADAS